MVDFYVTNPDLGPDGVVVTGPFNSTERVITVVRDTVSQGPMQ